MDVNGDKITKFGCCHRYIECSNQGFCIHPDERYRDACRYKENLDSGRNFYATNKIYDDRSEDKLIKKNAENIQEYEIIINAQENGCINASMEYDGRKPSSIEAYAKKLVGKTFAKVIEDDSSSDVEDFSNKGDLGQLVEKHHFHYECNSDSRPDFPEAGVELKVTPFKENKDGSVSAKERLVLTKINYNDVVNEDFETGHFWTKSRLLLLIYYLYRQEVLRRYDYEIKYAHLFTPPSEDLMIIRNDYNIIVNKIKSGRAHELSESDTMYLAACTKGSKSTDRISQPFSDIPAKPRAFSFKTSYMTYVLNNYVIPGKDTYEAAFGVNELRTMSFEEALQERVSRYVGLYEEEIERALGIEVNRQNKSYEAILACRMLGVKSNRVEEFVKAGIITKIIRFREEKSKNQEFRLEDFKLLDLASEAFDTEIVDEETGEPAGWEASALYDILKNRKYFLLVFWEDDKGTVFKGCQIWGMPESDMEIVRDAWNRTKHILKYGVELTKVILANGKVNIENNLPGVSDNGVFHIRPHAVKSYYELKDGQRYGSGSITDSDLLPSGERMTKQAYWLNRAYIEGQLDDELVKKYKR
ncbi:Sau3AI family type II restriction endonuclease [Butyrivibrio sp. AE3009]|uniref:Sau3AI family type II restriction endonuclease n=1 Tax=Butyrivibrio sp. AE3009 TaxID=1280666 RepID=UPI0003B6F913|nr:Sau3AI family type II restriction endonuclease [Butyrivibrio sp. AE3009]